MGAGNGAGEVLGADAYRRGEGLNLALSDGFSWLGKKGRRRVGLDFHTGAQERLASARGVFQGARAGWRA